jgi:uncharacterized protein YneF (UPF0154 family)
VDLWIIMLIVLVVLIGVLVALYFVGKRLEKKQAAQQQQIESAAQNVTMLIIDKKRMKLKEAGLPAVVIEQTPKLLRGSKLPIVKAKVGPKVMTLICDEKIFELVPVKKEVKAVVSGIYITSVKGVRGPLEAPAKKQKFFKRMTSKFIKPKEKK